MSSAARFVLEFEATGDQEVVNKIKAVGEAGKTTATDLQALQGIQDPFEPIATGADAAIAPVEGVGTAVTETAGTMTELTTEGEAAATGMEDFGTKTEEAAGSTEGFSSSMASMTGAIAAIGGTIGSLIGSFTRYNEIQLKVQKAQLTSARATEMSRKAEEGLDNVLKTATSNTANIAAAREKLAQAQGEMNKLMDQGVTSGAAFEQAQSNLQAAQKGLSAEFAKGGGDIAKLTTAMEKSEINSAKMVTSLNNLEVAIANQKKGILDMVFDFTSLGGSLVQTATGFPKIAAGAKQASAGFKDLVSWIGRGGLSITGLAGIITGTLLPALALAFAGFEALKFIPDLWAMIVGKMEDNNRQFLTGLFNIVDQIAALGQAVTSIIPGASKKFDDVRKMIDVMRKTSVIATTDMGKGYFDLGGQVENLVQKYQNILKPIDDFNTGVTQGTPLTSRFAGSARMTGTSLAEMGSSAEDAANSTAAVGEAAEVAGRLQSRFTDSVRLTGPAYESIGDKVIEVTDKIKEAQGTMGDVAIDVANQITEGNQAFFESQVKNNEEITKGKEVLSGYAAAMDDTINSVENAREALGDETQALQDQIASLQDVESQDIRTTNAILQRTVAYEESKQKVRDLNTVLQDHEAREAAIQTAVNETAVSLGEEAIALEAAGRSADSAGQQQQRLHNAYQSGVVSIKEWTNELATAEAEEQGQIDALAGMGATFQKLPGFIEPTIDNLKLMAAAMKGGADDAVAYGDAIREAFMTATEEARSGMEELIGLFEKGEANEKFDEWFEGLPESVRESFTSAEKEGLKEMGKFWSGMQDLAKGFDWMVLVRGFEGARQWLSGQYDAWAAENEGTWKTIFERASDIAAVGSDGIITKMQEILSSGLPPETILGQLEDLDELAAEIGEKGGAALADKFAPELQKLQKEGIITMDTMADLAKSVDGLAEGMAGSSEGLNALFGAMDSVAGKGKELVLDFDKLNKVVIDGVGTLVQVGDQLLKVPDAAGSAGSALAGLGVDATDAHTKLTALHTILTLIPQITVAPHIDVDTTDAYTKLSALHQALTAINSVTLNAIKITVDAGDAHTKLTALHQALTAINGLTLEPITIMANTTQAVSSLNAASNAALTMRNNVNAASSGVKSAVAGAGAAVTSFSSKASSSFTKTGAAGTQMANKVKSASSSMKSSLSSAASSAASFASKCVSSFNKVGSSATSNASKVNKLASAISKLKSKTITITTRYVTSGRPGGLQHGGSFIADSPTTIGGTKIGEHYKPELVTVTPLTNPNSLDKTITVNTPGGRGGGSREVVIPVTLMLDNKVLIRTVRRGLVEEVSGIM